MIDLRPVANIIGWLLVALGGFMLVPLAVDLALGSSDWQVFLLAGFVTATVGALVAMATSNALGTSLSIRQSFLVTTLSWTVLPAFGALPLYLGLPGLSVVDALFEAMSGMTTTGATVLVGLDTMPPGILLWRSILQWLGGLGIVIVALIFMPVMRLGGMQHFRSEGFDTMGKVLPRAADISWMLLQIYTGLTVLCAAAFVVTGMSLFDAVNHSMATIATGGYSTRDASMAGFGPASQWACTVFMWLATLPFIRFVQAVNGDFQPLYRDIQVRAYLRWTAYAIGLVVVWRLVTTGQFSEQAAREVSLNVVSMFSGTGFTSADVSGWGDFALLVVIVAGFIGGCTASTGCSIKVFRYLVLFEAIKGQLRQMMRPNRVVILHLGGKRLEEDVVTSVIVMFTTFVLGFAVLTILLSVAGLEMRSAFTGAWTAILNVGPVWGPEVGPTGAVDGFPEGAKWLMILAMLMGRLEMVSVLVLLLPWFWRG